MNVVSHPLWLGALFVLFLNDHLLKQSVWAGAATGKLSDFAGLMVAPVVLAVIFGVRSKRGLAIASLATGVVFAAINLSPSAAIVFDGLVSLVVPFHTIVDPTDLIALIAIPFSLYLYRDTMLRPPMGRRVARAATIVLASSVCVATSMEEPCAADSDCEQYEECVNELCELKPTPCDSNADCNDGWACQQNVCRFISASSNSNDARDLSLTPVLDQSLERSQPGVDQFELFTLDRAIDVCVDANTCLTSPEL